MSTARSWTDIANRSLTRIGTAKRLAAWDTDTSPVGLAVRDAMPGAIESTLVQHPWDCAIRRVALPARDTAPAYGFARAFDLPGDCLRWLPPEPHEDIYFEAEQEGVLLLTNAEAPLPVRYLARIEDARVLEAHVVDVLIYRLALDLSYAVTALAEVSRLTEEGWAMAIRDARRIEGRKAPRRDRSRSGGFSWLEARDGGGEYFWPGARG